MTGPEKELLVARICSGSVRITLERTYVVRHPGRDHLYQAAELYAEVFRQSQLEGLYSDQELLEFMLEHGFWDDEREKFLKSLPKEIEQFKHSLFKSNFKSNQRKTIRKALAIAKSKLAEVHTERHAWDYLSCSGAAAISKTRFLVGCSLFSSRGQRVFGDDDFWVSECGLLDEVVAALARVRLDDVAVRELARTEPWRAIWAAHKVEGSVFGVAPADYSDEQKAVVNWSCLYDNIYQHPHCPADDVIEDDDVLDGWMIEQKQQREKALAGASVEDAIGSEKIRDMQEIFVPAETAEDARKVVDMNDEFGKATQKRRFDYLAKKGEVNEQDMPDTRQRLQMQMANAASRR
jgi:hypothetical protein